MNLRQFNEEGIAAFRKFLAECREKPETPAPREMLEDGRFTAQVAPTIVVDDQEFASRKGAAEYLNSTLSPLSDQMLLASSGIWTWLSLFFFDAVCPAEDGKRQTKVDSYYVYEAHDSRYARRHLLCFAWRVLKIAPRYNRLLLAGKVSGIDKVAETVLARLFLIRIPAIFEVLDRLYWDKEKDMPRRGIANFSRVTPGDLVHRLPIRIRQLEKTYDLISLNADQIIDLLGQEFRSTSLRAKG